MDNQLTRVLGATNPLQPTLVDLGTVNSAYRPIYEAYNQQIQGYQQQEQAARNAAMQAQDVLNQELGTTLGSIERQRQTGLETARQTAGESEAKLRAQARAIGGAPSSGFLELSNQLQKGLGQQVANIGQSASTNASSARTQALKSLASIEQDLNSQIAGINANRTLSLRQKDAMIEDAISKAKMASMYNSMLSGGIGDGTTTQTPNDPLGGLEITVPGKGVGTENLIGGVNAGMAGVEGPGLLDQAFGYLTQGPDYFARQQLKQKSPYEIQQALRNANPQDQANIRRLLNIKPSRGGF